MTDDAVTIAAAVRAGRTSARAVAEACLERIDTANAAQTAVAAEAADAALAEARAALLERKLDQLTGFRRGLERAFPLPRDWAANAPDELVVCRCENVTAGTLRQTVAVNGADELNRLKALSRVGMGRCQGRMCGVAAAEILAHATGQPLAQVGRLRGQAPVKPIPIRLVTQAPAEGART